MTLPQCPTVAQESHCIRSPDSLHHLHCSLLNNCKHKNRITAHSKYQTPSFTQFPDL